MKKCSRIYFNEETDESNEHVLMLNVKWVFPKIMLPPNHPFQ